MTRPEPPTHFNNLGDLIRRDEPDRNWDLDKIAVIDLGGEVAPREFTYRALDQAAAGVAGALVRRGFARGERIAILSANRFEYLATYFGIMRAGLVAVPVNFKFPRSTIHFILRDSGARLVFCDTQRRAQCPAGLDTVTFGSAAADGFDAWFDDDRAGREAFETVVVAPGEPAMFLYTSGSSGVPKGVVLSHRSHIWVAETRLGTQDLSRHRYLIAAPLYHMNALAMAKLASIGHSTIVLLAQFVARDYIAAIGRYRCTWLTAVPPMLAMMLRETETMAGADLTSVEFVRMGSAPVSQSLMTALKHAFPRAAITNAYGTTEAGPVVFGPHPGGLPQPEMSVGYRHPLVDLRLVAHDAEGTPDPGGGARGVLEMKCPAVMSGYHNRPDLQSPITADGFYVTGDVFRRDENGFHYFVGRVDDMFVSGGENIYPADVERMLERHPAVAQAAVIPVEDAIKGSKPVAFVIRRPGSDVSPDEIKQFALANAPAYQHPRFVWFLDEMPLASTNKLDRASLKATAEHRVAAARG